MKQTRRSVFAGLAGALPAASVTGKATRIEPDVVTQAELEALRQLHLKLDLALHSIEWRLWAGASVEPGRHKAEWDRGDTAVRNEDKRPLPFATTSGVSMDWLNLEWS